MSECKSSPGRSAESWFHLVWPNLKWERRLGVKEPPHEMTERNESGRLVGEEEKPEREEVG